MAWIIVTVDDDVSCAHPLLHNGDCTYPLLDSGACTSPCLTMGLTLIPCLAGGAYLDFEVTLSYNFDEGEISYPPTHFQLRILKPPLRPPQ
jgi:hypothetical protein